MGDGGGGGSSVEGEFASEPPGVEGGRDPDRLCLDLLLLPDFMDDTSDLSVSPFGKPAVEFLGLSVFLLGIFERIERNDLVESLVSALLNEG